MKSKVLLVGPFKDAGLRVGQFLSPPNGIYRIASFVRKKTGAVVDVVDCDLEGVQKLEEMVLKNNYALVGFSLLYPTLENDLRLMHKVKHLSPGSVLVAGGQGAVFLKELLFLNSPLDLIVHGFGEFPIVDILNAIEHGAKLPEDFCNIQGLSIRTQNGIIDTPNKQSYSNQDFFEITSSFDYSAVPYERYWDYMESKYSPRELEVMKNDGLLYTIRIMTSSHCPVKCSFCSATNFLDDAVGRRQCALEMNVEDVITAVKESIKFHPAVNAFYFVDDNLLQNGERVEKLCRRLVSEFGEMKLNFFCLSRVDNIKPNILSLMKVAGFKLIIYGVESFSNKILKDMGKKVASSNPSKMAEKVVLQTLGAGITPLMNLILFYPTTTFEDIEETIEKSLPLIEKGARLTVFSFVEVYPGADILKESGLEFSFEKLEVDGSSFEVPRLIMPRDPKIKEFALSSLKKRDKIVAEISERYGYEKELPHPVFALSLFLAIYTLMGKPTKRIEHLIEVMMTEAKEKGVEEVFVHESA